MRIRFLVPKSKGWLGQVHKSGKAGIPRLSLSLLAALTPEKHEVEIVDTRFNDPGYDDLPDIAAISAFTGEVQDAYAMADEFRRRGTTVVIGGIHASMLPEEAAQHADVVVIGEAERTWPRLLEDFEAGRVLPTYRVEEFHDMKDLPIARRELLEKDRYFTISSLQSGRGCPFDCSFCSVTIYNGRKMRLRPVADVVREVETLPNKRAIMFLDDNVAIVRNYAKELFKALIPLKIRWNSQTSINCTDDPELMEVFHEFDVNILGSFVVGLDNDTKDIFKATLDFVMENSIDAPIINILTPYPGTVLYDEYEKAGRIFDHDWTNYYNSNVVFHPIRMTPAELIDGYYWLVRELYKPSNVAKRVFKRKGNVVSRIALNASYHRKAKRYPKIEWDRIGATDENLGLVPQVNRQWTEL